MTIKAIMTMICCVWLIGCTSNPEKTSRLGLAEMDDIKLAAEFKNELKYRDGKPMKLGLALSGGGTKAAVFAHGVLHGLHDSGLLDQVDAISSVSGGGYAAFWYYSKLMEAQRLRFEKDEIFQDCFPSWWDNSAREIPKLELKLKEDEEKKNDVLVRRDKQDIKDAIILQKAFLAGKPAAKYDCNQASHMEDSIEGDPFRWQAHIVRWPDLFRTDITKVTGGPQSYPTSDAVSLALSTVFELTVGWTGIESNLPKNYQYGIERTWGLNPEIRDIHKANNGEYQESAVWQYTNALPPENGKPLRANPARISWESLQSLYKSATPPPLWIINTTQGNKGYRPDVNNLYEITPFGHGSVRMGYKEGLPPVANVAEGVRAAAAFIDSQGLDSEGGRDTLNMIASFIPAGRWGVRTNVMGKDGQMHKVRLSDGGGADNLGLLSLIRRGMTDIIVVDAAQDIEGSMDDLCWDKVALQQEGLELKMDSLENFDKVCKERYPDGGGKATALRGYNVSHWLNPVIKGEVSWPTGSLRSPVNIWLIKPAWNQERIRKLYNQLSEAEEPVCGNLPGQESCFLLVYYGHNSTIHVKKSEKYLVFPQHGTVSATVNGSSYLTLAYRELGRELAARLKRDQNGSISITGNSNAIQPDFGICKHQRADEDSELKSMSGKEPVCD